MNKRKASSKPASVKKLGRGYNPFLNPMFVMATTKGLGKRDREILAALYAIGIHGDEGYDNFAMLVSELRMDYILIEGDTKATQRRADIVAHLRAAADLMETDPAKQWRALPKTRRRTDEGRKLLLRSPEFQKLRELADAYERFQASPPRGDVIAFARGPKRRTLDFVGFAIGRIESFLTQCGAQGTRAKRDEAIARAVTLIAGHPVTSAMVKDRRRVRLTR